MTWKISPSAVDEIARPLEAGYPLIYVQTWEEERLKAILSDCSRDEIPVWDWSASRGLVTAGERIEGSLDPLGALAYIGEHGRGAITLMRDLPDHLPGNPLVRRLLRDIYTAFLDQTGALVISHPTAAVPDELSKELHHVRLTLPDRHEIASFLEFQATELAAGRPPSPAWIEDCAVELCGLALHEIRLLVRPLMIDGDFDPASARALINDYRGQVLMKEGCLQLVENQLDLDQLGGLATLKQWILSRHQLFGPRARQLGIAPPSGMLMMGVSGCGKSLAAKAIASAWKLPLVRLDMNLIMSGGWGTPELAWARALAAIESVAPVVVWIDEIENSFGYMNGQATSGNLTIFSSFLTWMQEKARDVFVVATANNIDLLPAEMLRKGRFDELFFLDLPKAVARSDILRIHIERQGANPGNFDTDQLAELLEGWTASELEQLVKAARLAAFYESRDFTYNDLKNTSFKMVPLSKTMSEQINELRRWARSRAVPAD